MIFDEYAIGLFNVNHHKKLYIFQQPNLSKPIYMADFINKHFDVYLDKNTD